MPIEVQLPGGQSPARRDLKWSVWHCRNTVAYDVSGDNGLKYFVTKMDRYNKCQIKQYTRTHTAHTLVGGQYLAG